MRRLLPLYHQTKKGLWLPNLYIRTIPASELAPNVSSKHLINHYINAREPSNSSFTMSNNYIKVTVGGKDFHTGVGTLTAESGYFQGLLSGRWDVLQLSVSGECRTCFLDANPDLFSDVLEYMRIGHMPLLWNRNEGFDVVLYSRLLGLAHFLIIPTMIEWIENPCYESVIVVTVTASSTFVAWTGDLEFSTTAAIPNDVTAART